jgi:hypothetical protein
MPPSDYKQAAHGAHHAAIVAAPFLLSLWSRIKAWFRRKDSSVEGYRFEGFK